MRKKHIKSLFCLAVILVAILFSKKVILKYKANLEYEISLSEQLSADEKIKFLKQAIQYDPENAKYYKDIGMIRYYQTDYSAGKGPGQYKLAGIHFKQAISLNPSKYVHHHGYASSLYKDTKDIKKLIKSIKTANKLNPYNEMLSEYLESLKQFEP